jgi:hypothetical protein
VTRFSKDSTRRRGETLSQRSEIFEKPRPLAPFEEGAKDIIGSQLEVVLWAGPNFFSKAEKGAQKSDAAVGANDERDVDFAILLPR